MKLKQPPIKKLNHKTNIFYSILSKVKMACLSINANMKPCRNYAVSGDDFCACHDAKSLNKQWKKRYMSPSSPSLALLSEAEMEHFVSQLNSGHIKVTKKDVERIPDDPKFIELYLFLIHGGFAEPFWNTKLYLKTILFLFELEQLGARNHPLFEPIVDVLITRDQDSFEKFLASAVVLVREGMIQRSFYPHLFALMLVFLEMPGGIEFCWSNPYARLGEKFKEMLSESGQNFQHFLDARFWPEVREVLATQKGILKAKMDHIKEELMMNRWHPTRVELYLEMDIDVDDM